MSKDARAYLCVDVFLRDLVGAGALRAAFELKLIDFLQASSPATEDRIERALAMDGAGIRLLVELLVANRVIARDNDGIRLTDAFLDALRFRELLEAKLEFARIVAADFADHSTALIGDPDRFMREARLFRLFDYGRAIEPTPENFARTRRWMRLTTALTRHEAPVCLEAHDLARHRRMLDIGGNSGEFALQACRRHPALEATVVDLPLVCEIGREHLSREAEADRIGFVAADALNDPLPGGFDLVSFKSVLHDWPDASAERLLERATEALEPGGTLLVFERGPIAVGSTPPPYSMIQNLLFFRSFRSSGLYRRRLEALGYRDLRERTIELEMPFMLLSATRGADG